MRGILFTLFFFYLILQFTSCSLGRDKSGHDFNSLERELINKVDKLYAEGSYSHGVDLLLNYLERFPNSPYNDDASYRLAYVYVINDDNNKYYNLKKAEIKFREVIKKYPETNYIYACKNWINILNLYNSFDKQNRIIGESIPNGENLEFLKVVKENNGLKIENKRLKKTLSELEEALQR
jgi:hypothetical protein